jgi:hypothetical protein
MSVVTIGAAIASATATHATSCFNVCNTWHPQTERLLVIARSEQPCNHRCRISSRIPQVHVYAVQEWDGIQRHSKPRNNLPRGRISCAHSLEVAPVALM